MSVKSITTEEFRRWAAEQNWIQTKRNESMGALLFSWMTPDGHVVITEFRDGVLIGTDR